MLMTEVADRFVRALRALGGDPEMLEPLTAWRAFKAFAGEEIDELPADSDLDRLLLEAGPSRYGPDGEPAFMLEFERQYRQGADAEDAGTASVLCSFAFPLDDRAQGVEGVQLWGVPGPASDTWIAAVESSPPFTLITHRPTHASLEMREI
jgi:hypothetical protein